MRTGVPLTAMAMASVVIVVRMQMACAHHLEGGRRSRGGGGNRSAAECPSSPPPPARKRARCSVGARARARVQCKHAAAVSTARQGKRLLERLHLSRPLSLVSYRNRTRTCKQLCSCMAAAIKPNARDVGRLHVNNHCYSAEDGKSCFALVALVLGTTTPALPTGHSLPSRRKTAWLCPRKLLHRGAIAV